VSRRILIIDPRARDQLTEAFSWWADHRSSEQAGRWLAGIERAISRLEENADQHPLAAESRRFPEEVRQLNFGLGRRPTHRILFSIRRDSIYVFSVRHVAQGEIHPDDLS
jgi:plasmid stabilization system protein ParE